MRLTWWTGRLLAQGQGNKKGADLGLHRAKSEDLR